MTYTFHSDGEFFLKRPFGCVDSDKENLDSEGRNE